MPHRIPTENLASPRRDSRSAIAIEWIATIGVLTTIAWMVARLSGCAS